jgi:predicted MPP superfamily phosphohydrolase
MRRLRLPEHDLALPHWPQRLDGLRVALVTDLHAGGPRVRRRHLEALVDSVNAAAVDLVVLAGDFVDPKVLGGWRIDPAAVAQRLARLRSPSVAVLGNHDWHHEGHGVGLALRHAGIPVLENDSISLEQRGGPLHIAGVADTRYRDPRVGSALTGIPDGEPILFLAHDPDLFPYVPARVSLTLAGHLHGGQIDVPVLRRFVMPTRHGSRYKEGHVVESGRHLFVSRGVGETGLPIRVGAPPEVPILRLQPEETPGDAGKF